MNRRRVVAILSAVVLTLFGTLILIAYVNRAEERAREGTRLVDVLFARESIPVGTPFDQVPALTEVKSIPANARPDDAVEGDEEDLVDKVVTQQILPGVPILRAQFGAPADITRAGAIELGEGREEVTVALAAQRVLGGELSAGDMVGVIVSFGEPDPDYNSPACTAATGMVLAGIAVTDVRNAVNPETDAGGGDVVSITLDVDQSEAERIAFAAEFASIWLTRQGDNSRLVADNDTFECDEVFSGLGGRSGSGGGNR